MRRAGADVPIAACTTRLGGLVSSSALLEVARLPKWLVTMQYSFPGMSGSDAVARSLPVDGGPNGPESMSLGFAAKVHARDPAEAGAIGRARLFQHCRERGLPDPAVAHVTAWPTGRARRRQQPVPLDRWEGGGGTAGVREPRRPGPAGPPPATAYAEEPPDAET